MSVTLSTNEKKSMSTMAKLLVKDDSDSRGGVFNCAHLFPRILE